MNLTVVLVKGCLLFRIGHPLRCHVALLWSLLPTLHTCLNIGLAWELFCLVNNIESQQCRFTFEIRVDHVLSLLMIIKAHYSCVQYENYNDVYILSPMGALVVF